MSVDITCLCGCWLDTDGVRNALWVHHNVGNLPGLVSLMDLPTHLSQLSLEPETNIHKHQTSTTNINIYHKHQTSNIKHQSTLKAGDINKRGRKFRAK